MEFCKEALTFEQTKSYDVTIQMKALCLYLHMVLFVFHDLMVWTQLNPLGGGVLPYSGLYRKASGILKGREICHFGL